MCFRDGSSLIILSCSCLLQTNTSVTYLSIWSGFALNKPDKWMCLALQVRNLCCYRVREFIFVFVLCVCIVFVYVICAFEDMSFIGV